MGARTPRSATPRDPHSRPGTRQLTALGAGDRVPARYRATDIGSPRTPGTRPGPARPRTGPDPSRSRSPPHPDRGIRGELMEPGDPLRSLRDRAAAQASTLAHI